MKFTVLKENFSKSLNIVGKAVNLRSPLPILSNILVKTEKGQLKLVASNLQMTITCWTGAKIDEQGEISVPARLITEFVGQVNEDKIQGELESNTLMLHTDKVKAKFLGTPASEFPEIPVVQTDIVVTVNSKDFIEALQKVSLAVATDEGRPVLTGIYFNIDSSKKMVMACTDGFRMTEYSYPITLDRENEEPVSCIVPAKSLVEVAKPFAAESKELSLAFQLEKNLVVIRGEDMEAQLRLIEGEYPDYKAIIPAEYKTKVDISRSEFTNAIKLASVFARDLGNMVKFTIGEDNVVVESQPTEAGNTSTDISAEVDGDNLEIAFNARYLLDLLTIINDDEITIKATESVKPGLITLEKIPQYIYLIMPMKSNW